MKTQRMMDTVKNFKIKNNFGLHARTAAKIVELGNQYQSQLFLKKNNQEVDGASILSILTLSCPKGTDLEARIVGEDCQDFMEKLSLLFKQNFGESQ